MRVEEISRIILGRTYRFHLMMKVKRDGEWSVEDVEGLHYKPLRWARDGRTAQEQVAYIGIDGKDEGEVFTCSLYDFSVKFRLVPLTEPENGAQEVLPPMPEKVASNLILGSGV